MTNRRYTHIIRLQKVRIIGIRGIIHYSRQVCSLLFLAFQYSSPGGSTTAGEVCYLRLPCFTLHLKLIVVHLLQSSKERQTIRHRRRLSEMAVGGRDFLFPPLHLSSPPYPSSSPLFYPFSPPVLDNFPLSPSSPVFSFPLPLSLSISLK